MSRTPPCDVNLNAFDSRFFRTCWTRLASVRSVRSSRGSRCTSNEAPALGFVLERPGDHVDERREVDLFGLDGHRARLDLRQIEDVGDQIQQVGAGRVDGPGELDLLPTEIPFGVVAQLLAENQDAVERRPELVRHVGEELRLVLGRQRELRRLVFELAAGLFDFLILPLAPRRSAPRAAAPSVRAARWSAAAPSAASAARSRAAATAAAAPSVCIVASMLFKTMPMLAVSCSRKARCVGRNSLQRCDADDGLHLRLEDHREDDQVLRQSLEEDRSDRRGAARERWSRECGACHARTGRGSLRRPGLSAGTAAPRRPRSWRACADAARRPRSSGR